jgi:putative Mn2+ efflux pump MntP
LGVLALLLVAVALGLSNLAAAVGIGIAGVSRRTWVRVGVVFGLFETGMPIVGLLLGRGAAASLGHATRWIGAGLLVLVGAYTVIQAVRGDAAGPATVTGLSMGKLLAAGLALSIDNLAVGFALSAYQVSLPLAVAVIGAVSVSLSLLGLELGDRLGTKTADRGELLGGLVLIAVGLALATNIL